MRSPRSFLFFFLSVFSAPVTSEAQVDVKVSSKWGPWGEWSPCSRTCGVGVSYQERECLEKSKPEIYCKGDMRTHRTCNIQDCPEGSRNFRYEQCEAFNNRTLDGHKYKWVPYVPAHQTCVLNCMPKGKFFFVRWADKVVDGTKCTSESYDICVDGKCKKLGCDLILNSSAKEDKCRVCNGNGENCRTHRGNYTSAGDGYKEIVVIPVSATNIDVREMTPSPHFLALADSSDTYFLNGDYVIARSQKVKIAGAVFQYERTGYGQERLFSLGPTTEPVHVQILLNGNRNARVSYEFSVPKSVTKLPAPTQFSWKTGEFDKCSSSCAGGEQKRRVYCVRDNNGKEVSKSNCNRDEKPSHRRKCNTQPCPASWFISAWSTCSQTCRRGKQVRRVHCNHVIEGGDTAMIPDDQCPDSKPTTMRSCEVEKSCPRWSMGLWSKCSVSCGMGTRRRDVKCKRLGSKASLPAESCDLDKKPRHVEKCNPGPCTVSWMASDWSECYPSCGKGMSTRMVYCVSISNNDQKYPDDLCDNSSKPISKKECFSDSPCPPMWHGSQWSRCTATCGVGMQMRNVLCAAKEGQDMLRILPNDKCKEEKKMNGVQKCSVRPCQAGWYIYPWQQCSTTCGQGTKRRSVKCFADSKEDPDEKWCIAENKPVMEEQCFTKECEVPTTQPTTPKQTTTASTTKPSSPLTSTTSAPTTVPATTTERTTTKKTTTRPTVTTARRLKPARITLPPKDIMAYVGTEVLFRCKATGDPKPVISWRKGSIPVSSLDSSRIQILPDGDLRVADIIEDDNDIYTCIATNFVGPMDTKVARLAVIVPVSVVVSPKNTTVRPGKQVTITCTSRGKPTPTVEWYKDGRFLSSRSGLQVTRTTVTISKAQTFDSGKYQCRGSHNYGFASDSMNLRVVKKIEPTDAPVKCNDNPAIAHCEVVRRVRYCCIPYYMKACCKTCEDLLPGCSKRNK